MQTVKIENTGPSPLTLILPHDLACSETSCLCLRQRVVSYDHNPKTGDVSGRTRTQRTPSSVQLFGAGRPGSVSQDLPASVQRAPDVVRAKRLGTLKVVPVPAPVAAPAAAEAAKVTEAAAASAASATELAPAPEAEALDTSTDSPRRKRS